jgi:hypothetical protein
MFTNIPYLEAVSNNRRGRLKADAFDHLQPPRKSRAAHCMKS